MTAELGVTGQGTNGAAPTWHETVYGAHIPTAEHFRTAEAAFGNFVEVNNKYESALVHGTIAPDEAQEYANRVARFELGMREFCRSAKIDPQRATLDVLIGRSEKYIEVWHEAMKRVIAAGHEPTVALIKDECRTMWGKHQFTITDDEKDALEVGRPKYEEAIRAGFTPEEAREFAKLYLDENNYSTEREYLTDAGESRHFDVTKYLGLKSGLQGIVDSSREFEKLTGQDAADSMIQLVSEMAEVVELRSFFHIENGNTPGEPAQIILNFNSIQEFHDAVRQRAAAGDIKDDELEIYTGIHSLEGLEAYIQEHLAYECIDVVVAAGGLLHRINADIGLAEVDAGVDRLEYDDIVPVIKKHLPVGVDVTPGLARSVRRTAEALSSDDPRAVVPLAIALLGNNRYPNDPDLLLR